MQKTPCDDRQRDCSEAAISREVPRIDGYHQSWEEARKASTHGIKGSMLWMAPLGFSLQKCKRINFC